MSIQLISISHKTAALDVRERFAFNGDVQCAILRRLGGHCAIEECVIVATCNRTEVYTWSSKEKSEREIFEYVQGILLEAAGIGDRGDIGSIFRFYSGKKAMHHLFDVACGLDSMVMGEDQILGQVKQAHHQAMEAGVCGTYLNTFFRYAVTAAKKVKTDTGLSKTPVSTATICMKAAEKYVGGLENKNVMIIGASGKIGSIVMKNLLSENKCHVYVTVRNKTEKPSGVSAVTWKHGDGAVSYMEIPYEQRYDFIAQMDVIVSATASPHYTLTFDSVARSLANADEKKPMTEKGLPSMENEDENMGVRRRAFMDLAVPLDIESRIGTLPGVLCSNIDDFGRTARENNESKLKEAAWAREILEDYENQFEKWMIFQNSLETMGQVKEIILKDMESKSVGKAMDKFFYRVRETATPEQLQVFMECLRPELWSED